MRQVEWVGTSTRTNFVSNRDGWGQVTNSVLNIYRRDQDDEVVSSRDGWEQ
jgi:hypothetical protein